MRFSLADALHLVLHAATQGVSWNLHGAGMVQLKQWCTCSMEATVADTMHTEYPSLHQKEIDRWFWASPALRHRLCAGSSTDAVVGSDLEVDAEETEAEVQQVQMELADELEETLRRLSELARYPKWSNNPGADEAEDIGKKLSPGSVPELCATILQQQPVPGLETSGNALAQVCSPATCYHPCSLADALISDGTTSHISSQWVWIPSVCDQPSGATRCVHACESVGISSLKLL